MTCPRAREEASAFPTVCPDASVPMVLSTLPGGGEGPKPCSGSHGHPPQATAFVERSHQVPLSKDGRAALGDDLHLQCPLRMLTVERRPGVRIPPAL